MANPPKARRVRSLQSGVSGGNYKSNRGHGTSSKPGGKGKKLLFLQDTCYRCGKGKHQKIQDCRLWMLHVEDVERKDTLRRSVKAKCSTHSLEIPEASNNSTGEPLYFNDDGQPVFTHMVSVPHANKHLIKFPIALDYKELKIGSRNKLENCTDSTGHSKLSTILLKADTGADVNLMNKQTFDQLFGQAKDLLKLTPIRMENYGNSAVKVLGMFHVFLKWKDNVYRQLFYVTNCDWLPKLFSCDACYTLGVLKPCYTVEKWLGISEHSIHSTQSQATSSQASKVGNSFLHQEMKGTVRKTV